METTKLSIESISKRKPTKKKVYKKMPEPETFTELDLIFNKYFKFNNCMQIFNTIKRFATFDGVLTSGTTSGTTQIVVEYKRIIGKGGGSVVQYDQCLLEKKKYRNLLLVSQQFGDVPIFYICEFDECILVYELVKDNSYVEHLINTQSDNRGGANVDKFVYFLPYSAASLIIGKNYNSIDITKRGKYVRATYDQLNYFIQAKRNS